MDYLWELRRRQQAALNRLLTGSPSKEETTAEEEVLRRAAEVAEKAPAGREKGISRPTAEQGKLIGQAESGEALSSAKRKAWDRAEADDRLLDGLTAQAEEFQQARRADALWRSETFSTGTLPGLLMAEGSRAAMEVEDISRAVQRVQRRRGGQVVLQLAGGGMQVLSTGDIYYLETHDRLLWYHTTKGEFSVRASLASAEKQLAQYHFSRCNQCYLVNLKYVKAVENDFVHVNTDHLEISRRQRAAFLTAVASYIGGVL